MLSSSLNGFFPTAWGPAFWFILYVVAANYHPAPSRADKIRMAQFVKAMASSLPCGKCRENFSANARAAGLNIHVFDNRQALFAWVYRLHRSVSTSLGSPLSFSLEEAEQRIERLRASSCTSDGHRGCLGGNRLKTQIRIRPDGELPSFDMEDGSDHRLSTGEDTTGHPD
jgi:hypothetical protein